MTVAEFEEQKHRLFCQHCGHEGLETYRNPNNGGVRPACPACGSSTPLPGVQWLPHQKAKAPRRGRYETDEVWRLNGDHCAFCGKSRALCQRLGIGLTAQHVMPFYKGGDDWPLIPFCSRCQQASAAALEETRRIDGHVSTLAEIIQRIEAKHPELRGGA